MKIKSFIFAASGFSLFSPHLVEAALVVGTSPVTLNFNNLNTNFGGSYSATGGTTTFPVNTTTGTAPIAIYSGANGVEFFVSTNDFNPGGVYSNTGTYSNSNSIRALQTASTTDFAIGVKDSANRSFVMPVRNGTGVTIPTWKVDYFVEQYSKGASATIISFSYSLDSGVTYITTGLTGGANVVANTTAPIDVNLSSVISTSRTATITASVVNGSEIWFRWLYDHQTGTSMHMGLDDITVAAIPEPNAAALLGVLGMFGILRRRR